MIRWWWTDDIAPAPRALRQEPDDDDVGMTLRRATVDDAHFLLALRNDPDVRAASTTQHEITPDEHAAFVTRALTDLFVVEEERQPIGSGRLDFWTPESAEISVSLLPAWRGRGYGRMVIDALAKEAARCGATHLTAKVKVTNVASLQAFLFCGFETAAIVRLDKAI